MLYIKDRACRFGVLLLVVLMLLPMFSLLLSAEPEDEAPSTTQTPSDTNKTPNSETLDILCSKAKSVYLYCPEADMTLYENNGDTPLHPYAVAKLCTLLVCADMIDDWTTPITIEKSMIERFSNAWGFEAGDSVSPYDLAVLMIFRGFDDATTILARYVAGSDSAFVDMMNEKARSLGATDTHFSNPTGRSDGGTTTAADAALIAAAFCEKDMLMSVAGQGMIKCESLKDKKIYNRNFFLSGYYNATGKSYLDSGKSGLIAGSVLDPNMLITTEVIGEFTYIAVILEADSESGRSIECDISKELVKAHKNSFSFIEVLSDHEPICDIAVSMGDGYDSAVVTSDKSFSFYLLNDSELSEIVRYTYTLTDQTIDAPVRSGTVVGELILYLNDVEVGRADLVTRANIRKSMKDYYYDRTKSVITDRFVLRFIMIAAAVLVVIVLATSFIRGQRKKKKYSEQHENG